MFVYRRIRAYVFTRSREPALETILLRNVLIDGGYEYPEFENFDSLAPVVTVHMTSPRRPDIPFRAFLWGDWSNDHLQNLMNVQEDTLCGDVVIFKVSGTGRLISMSTREVELALEALRQ